MNLKECCDEIAELGSRNSDLEREVLAVMELHLAALQGQFKTTSEYWERMQENVSLANSDGRYDIEAQRILAPDLKES